MADDLIGQMLGQYEIRMLLGKGGMSSVYLGYQPSMDRPVAIKVLPREFLHDETFLARFQRETRIIARLEHLHILPVYDVGEYDGIPYIVMRYLTGGTVADMIDAAIPELTTTVRIISQAADALDYAHERGIIHRDMKPSNILLDESGNAYLGDFGIARVAAQQASLTGSRIVGTPPYVAPDMVRKEDKVTHSVDVYALGIITYEMLTGMPPYIDEDPMKVLMSHVLEPVPVVRDMAPSVSPAVDAVLRRCLAKTAIERYRSAGAYARALREAAEATAETMPRPGNGDEDEDQRTVRADARPRRPIRRPLLKQAEAKPDPKPADAKPQPARPSSPRLVQADTPPTGVQRMLAAAPSERVAPLPAAEDDDSPRRRGCWLAFVIVTLMVAGIALTTFALTGGDWEGLMAALEPYDEFDLIGSPAEQPPTPTITPSPQPGETLEPTAVADLILPPPAGGDRLAFTSNRDGDYDIYVIDIDGSNLLQLTDNGDFDFDPGWSPDGNRIVYASSADGDSEIMIMNADGSDPVQLTENDDRDADPVWSPDGQWIAFSSDRDGDFDLYVMRPDGNSVRQLTFNDRDDYSPTWSPDSQQISYYVSQNENPGTSELYVLSVFTAGAPQRLTNNEALDQWPDWSPDGEMLVFTSAQGFENGARGLVLYELATGLMTQLTETAYQDDDPTWSPDGEWIAFDSDRDGGAFFDIYVMSMADREPLLLVDADANDVVPVWQPQP